MYISCLPGCIPQYLCLVTAVLVPSELTHTCTHSRAAPGCPGNTPSPAQQSPPRAAGAGAGEEPQAPPRPSPHTAHKHAGGAVHPTGRTSLLQPQALGVVCFTCTDLLPLSRLCSSSEAVVSHSTSLHQGWEGGLWGEMSTFPLLQGLTTYQLVSITLKRASSTIHDFLPGKERV